MGVIIVARGLNKQRVQEFYKIELKKGGIVVNNNSYPKLSSSNTSNEEMFLDKSDNKLFVIGAALNLPPAVYLLDSNNNKFDHFTSPTRHPDCAVLDGKIYHFQNICMAHLDRSTGNEPVPSFLEIIHVPPELGRSALGMIADPRNKRILLNFYGELHGYCVADKEFKLIAKGVHVWSPVLALAGDDNNLLCVYYKDTFYAYYLSKKKTAQKLKVIWEESSISSYLKFRRWMSYDSLSYVGNNNFWFAAWCPDIHLNSTLYFFKFKVRRQGNDLICTPLKFRKHFLEATCMIFDFALLQGEEVH